MSPVTHPVLHNTMNIESFSLCCETLQKLKRWENVECKKLSDH